MAKKFENILFCTDLDDTLLTTGDKRLSDENRKAINYFMEQGGKFTFATGRTPMGAKLLLNMITPNAPMICFNGGAIYDFNEDKILWGAYLDKSSQRVFEFVEEEYPHIGIEVCTDDVVYFCKENRISQMHRFHENLPHIIKDYREVEEPWKKGIFLCEEDSMPILSQRLLNSEFAKEFDFVQSSENYFEILPKGVSKGAALLKLADILEIDRKRTIGIGDNHNDVEMIRMAGVGVAVKNAVDRAKKVADIITVTNDENAISAVISALDEGIIKL